MVLELKQPAGDGPGDLLTLGPTLLAYAISYLFIAIYWVNHHLIFRLADRINRRILWCNIAWLFTLSFIPFTTAWVGSWPRSWVPLCLYFADMALACYTFHQLYYLVLQERGEPFRLSLRGAMSVIVYTGAALLGGFCPPAAFAAVAAVSLWWIAPLKKKEERGEGSET